MRTCVLLGGLLAMAGAVSAYGCSSSSDHPPVLDGTGSDSGRSGSSSGGISGGSSGGGSGSSSGGQMCPMVDGGCTDLGLCGAKVNSNEATGNTPLPQGGTIVPGTYVLTKIDYYGNMSTWVQETLRLTAPGGSGDGGAAEGGDDAAMAEAGGGDGASSEGGSEGGVEMDATTLDAGGGDAGAILGYEDIVIAQSAPLSTSSGTVSFLSSTVLSITYTCGGLPTTPWGYTATPTSLALIAPPTVFTYTKQ